MDFFIYLTFVVITRGGGARLGFYAALNDVRQLSLDSLVHV